MKDKEFKIGNFDDYSKGNCDFWSDDNFSYEKAKVSLKYQILENEIPIEVNKRTNKIEIDYSILHAFFPNFRMIKLKDGSFNIIGNLMDKYFERMIPSEIVKNWKQVKKYYIEDIKKEIKDLINK